MQALHVIARSFSQNFDYCRTIGSSRIANPAMPCGAISSAGLLPKQHPGRRAGWRNDVHQVDGFVFDLDGTVYLGDAALPGSVEGIAALRARNKQVLFVSNKPLEPRQNYAAKLTRLGIPTAAEDVITSAYVLGHHLAHHEADLRLYVIGEQSLRDELRGHGLTVLNEFSEQDPKEVIDPAGIDAVVVAFDRTLDYRKLNTAYQALVNGARFFATNADKTCPMPGGAIPDAGGTLAALEHMTGRKLELLAGKPSTLTMQVAIDKLSLPADRIMMVGDRLETDIYMGQQAGMVTAVTLTGVATRADVDKMAVPPDYVINNLSDLLGLIV
jgi:NagD protein